MGVRLFDRLPGGYALTVVGEEMRDSVLRIEEEVAALALKVIGQDQRPSGMFRITATDLLAVGVLPRHIAAFRTEWPGIVIEVVVADTVLDPTRREADVALRLGNPGQETLVGCRVGRLALAVYAAPGLYAREQGDPTHGDWIGYGSAHGPLSRSLARWRPQMRQVYRTNPIIAAMPQRRQESALRSCPAWLPIVTAHWFAPPRCPGISCWICEC